MAISDSTPIGSQFSRLTVTGAPFRNRHGIAHVPCRCICGQERNVACTALISGNTTSCGCARQGMIDRIIERANAERNYRGMNFGDKFGRLTLLRMAGYNGFGKIHAEYLCDCGLLATKSVALVKTGHVTSCGCAAPINNRLQVIPGEKIARLTVLRESIDHAMRGTAVDAECECGKTGAYLLSSIRSGRIKSCGCALADRGLHFITHGHSRGKKTSRTYQAYQAMLTRCTNPKNDHWDQYGGRGIKICNRWLESFENFLADMGECPSDRTLDRKEVNGNYEPVNCRWATDEEQMNNTQRSHFVEFNGERLTVTQWARRLNIPANTIYSRLNKQGWSVEKALTTPTGIGRNQFS